MGKPPEKHWSKAPSLNFKATLRILNAKTLGTLSPIPCRVSANSAMLHRRQVGGIRSLRCSSFSHKAPALRGPICIPLESHNGKLMLPKRETKFPDKVLCRLAARRYAPTALLAHSRSEWAEFLSRKGAGVGGSPRVLKLLYHASGASKKLRFSRTLYHKKKLLTTVQVSAILLYVEHRSNFRRKLCGKS